MTSPVPKLSTSFFVMIFLETSLLEGKRKRCEKVENNSNVSVFPSNPGHDNCNLFSFDPMLPLWVSYAISARVVDIVVDMIISDG